MLTGDGARIVPVDHVHAGARVACQRQQIDALAVEQPKRDGRMAQAVQAAALAVRPFLQTGFRQHPVEVKVEHPVRVVAVFDLGQKEVVVCAAVARLELRLTQAAVDAHRRLQGDDGFVVAFCFGQDQAQVMVAFEHDFHMPVLERLEVARPDKAVQHEADGPGQIRRHHLLGAPDLVALSHLLVRDGVGLAAQPTRAADDLPVLAGCERAPRRGVNLDLGEDGQLDQQTLGQRVVEHLAHHHQVLADGGG